MRNFFICLTLFLVTVFAMYVTVETDRFYHPVLVVAEFLVSMVTGGVTAYLVYQHIASENSGV